MLVENGSNIGQWRISAIHAKSLAIDSHTINSANCSVSFLWRSFKITLGAPTTVYWSLFRGFIEKKTSTMSSFGDFRRLTLNTVYTTLWKKHRMIASVRAGIEPTLATTLTRFCSSRATRLPICTDRSNFAILTCKTDSQQRHHTNTVSA